MNLETAQRLENGIDEALASNDLPRACRLASSYQNEAHAEPVRFRARFLSAQVALAAGDPAEAHRLLLLLLPPAEAMAGELSCRLWLMGAEALVRLGNHALARGHLLRARVPPEPLERFPLLKLRELRIRLWLGELSALAEELDRCARSLAGEPGNLALLLSEIGKAQDAHGDLDEAERYWTRSLGVRPTPDAALQLGRLAHLKGHLQEALDHYEAARASPVEGQRTEATLRAALVLLDLNQAPIARQQMPPLGGMPLELQPLARQVVGLLAGEADTQNHAAALAEERSPIRRARLALVLGTTALREGQESDARRWLELATQLAEEHGLPEVRWRALEARGRLAAELDGNEEEARALFEAAVLASEEQGRTLRHRADAASHGLRRADLLRRLLASACRRGDASAAFSLLELERGRLLVEMWRTAPGKEVPLRLRELERRTAEAPGDASLALERDRLLDAFLRDRSRSGDAALPTIPTLADLQSVLKPGQLFAAPVLAGDEARLLACWQGAAPRLLPLPPLAEQADALRNCLDAQLARYRLGVPTSRDELDTVLDALGEPLGATLLPLLDESRASQLVWVPDGFLHGVPVAALRLAGRYLIETVSVVNTFGGSLLVHQARHPSRRRCWGPTVVVAESAEVLPAAPQEATAVAAAFWRSTRLDGKAATREALRARLATAKAVHFACHAFFDPASPLSASIGLPSGEMWTAADWLGEPLDGMPLVTLSACRSAEVAPLVGREVFGLATALLANGVRSVLAGLWPVADRETGPLMSRFYRHRLTCDAPEALARAQRESLSISPLFWAAFALFGDPAALRPGLPGWLARRRQRWHAARFPNPGAVP